MFMDKKRRGMFGGVVVPGTPGIGDGIEERQQMEMGDPAPGLGMRGAPLPQQPTGFERPTGLRRAAGLFADFAAGLRGKEGQYAAMLEKRRETAAELANEQRKRSMGLEDYEAKKQIDRKYPAPVNNDTVADYEFIRVTLGEEEAQKFLKNKADPPRYMEVDDGRGGKRIIAIGQAMGGATSSLPDTLPADFFDNGGATPGGSPTFREAFAEWN